MPGCSRFPPTVRLIDRRRTVSGEELQRHIDLVVARLGIADVDRPRTVVSLTGPNSIEWVLAACAVRAAGHVLLPVAGPRSAAIESAYEPGIALAVSDEETEFVERHRRASVLHPDLAMLLSTSGSTGSPKLVRLSAGNVEANAAAIANYLDLGPDDCAVTSLPLHYCYGLSILDSHLAAGASIVLTDTSVVDPCFWNLVRDHGVTNVAGVPHTFDLLEQAPAADLTIPSLRFVTQAGGRLAPDRVLQWSERGRTDGWDFYVMYGQTEATSRIAYLPPHLTAAHPSAIGVPVPGGSIELRAHPAAGAQPNVGELVFRGPNVMMGYAECAADLGRGAELDELRTGDLARFDPTAGVYEIVGRAGRFIKPFGLRIDLDALERQLDAREITAACSGDDEHLIIATTPNRMTDASAAAAHITGLPSTRIRVVGVDPLPRTTTGKIDYGAIRTAALCAPVTGPTPVAPMSDAPRSVAAVLGEVLGRQHVDGSDTFVSMGGDSLSYVEASIRLDTLIGPLPPDWHLTAVDRLEAAHAQRASVGDPDRSRRTTSLDITVLLRAVGICTVLATHMRLARVPGGAHLMLAVAGYNTARFLAPITDARARLRAAARTVARVAVPTSAWIGVNMLIAGGYSLGSLLLVNNYTGSAWRRGGRWNYWYVEVLVQLLVLVAVVLAVPTLRSLERRAPWGCAMAAFVPLAAIRFEWITLGDDYNAVFRTHTVAWFFVLGWAVAVSRERWQRVVVSALAVSMVPGFFDRPQREWYIVAGLLALAWLPSVPFPRRAATAVGMLATASLAIYLTHWQVWPLVDRVLDRRVAYVVTLTIGVGASLAAARVARATRATLGRGIDGGPFPSRRLRSTRRPAGQPAGQPA